MAFKTQIRRGFTLIELLAAIGIMAAMMVLAAALLNGAGKGESRQALQSLTKGMLMNARTRAVSLGKPVAVVFAPYRGARDEHLGKAMTVVEVREDEVTGEWSVEAVLRRWSILPGRYVFSSGDTATGGQNVFTEDPVVEVPVAGDDSVRQVPVAMSAVIFGETGSVVWPAGSGELELHFEEGVVRNGMVTATNAGHTDWRKREVFVIGRQTGRARRLRAE